MPEEIDMLSKSGRPRKACNECKAQKTGCSGDRPQCKRCSRLNHRCIYDSSATRYQHFQHFQYNRPKPGTRARDLAPTACSSLQYAAQHNILPANNGPYKEQARTASYQPEPHLGGKSELPSNLIGPLIDTYFTNVYNSRLVLHEGQFRTDVQLGRSPPHLSWSVFALAALFYQDCNRERCLERHGLDRIWAERAGKLVSTEIEEPNSDNIVTCLNLAIFWYSKGEWAKASMHAAMATQTALILGVGSGSDSSNPWEIETLRRRFWACYCMSCHSFKSSINLPHRPAAERLPLPWPEHEFENGASCLAAITLNSLNGNGGIFTEMIKALTLWTDVRDFMTSSVTSMSVRVAKIQELDHRISERWSTLPAAFRLTETSVSSFSQTYLPQIVLTSVVYHQSLCALHSSIVPLFCGGTGEDEGWLCARQVSAQKAFDHACEASELLHLVHQRLGSVCSMPSFVAYAAFSANAIQIPFLWCRNESIKNKVQSHVKQNLSFIREMARYWKFAELLNLNLQHLYKLHAKDPAPLDSEPRLLEPTHLLSQKIKTVNARMTILAHTAILWKDSHSHVKNGEELVYFKDEETSIAPCGQHQSDRRKRASLSIQTPIMPSETHPTEVSDELFPLHTLPYEGNKQLEEHDFVAFSSQDTLGAGFSNSLEAEFNVDPLQLDGASEQFLMPNFDGAQMDEHYFGTIA